MRFEIERKLTLPSLAEALPGRAEPMGLPARHFILETSLSEFPSESQKALFGMGCFWGAERLFWQQPGIFTTAVGYAAGLTPNPTYEEVCSGLTGHNEVVLVVYDPEKICYLDLLRLFWQNHNPTQGMRQANDRGTQYRSGIYCFDQAQLELARSLLDVYQQQLAATVTTEIQMVGEFYYAEPYHQQYLAKNPQGYCNLQTLAKTGFPPLPEFN
jgi:peptide-methionine (S)-S-oxide reductase